MPVAVLRISVFPIPCSSGTYFVIGHVKHSQRLLAFLAKPWVAVKMEWTIVCAHCTCTAGLGEACSHIAALLFTLEANTKHQKRMTCTSLPCSWSPPFFKDVPYSLLTSQHHSWKGSECSNVPTRVACSKAKIPEPSAEELNVLYKNLSKATYSVCWSPYQPKLNHLVATVVFWRTYLVRSLKDHSFLLNAHLKPNLPIL